LITISPAQSIAEVFYTLSNSLADANTPNDILMAASQYARDRGAFGLVLFYIDNDAAGQAEWLEAVAVSVTVGEPLATGTRYYLPEFPFAKLWMSAPDKPILIDNIVTSTIMDDVSRAVQIQLGVGATVILPLNVRGSWVGLISISWVAPHPFDAEDARVYQSIAQQVGWRVDSVRKTEQLQKRFVQAESSARTIDERLQLLIHNAPVVLFAMDTAGQFTFSDGKGLEALGLKPGQVVGMDAFALYKDSPDVVAGLHRAMKGEEFTLPTHIGELVYQNWYAPERATDGTIVGVVGIAIDVSESKRAEQQIQRATDLLRLVIDSSPAWVYVKDTAHRYELVSRNYAETLHIPMEGLIGKTTAEVNVPGVLTGVASNIFNKGIDEDDSNVLTNGKVIANQEHTFTIDDQKRTLNTTRLPLRNPDGMVRGVLGIITDITLRRQLEIEHERLIRQLRETARFKDEFLAVMSHELRTPLNAMIGLLGIALMGHTLNERDTMLVTRARANSERLLSLINNILDISRIEAGRLEIVASDVAVRPLIEQLRNNMSVLADQKGLTFTTTITDALPPVILIDEDALTKIITNLVANALKFTEQGSVTLRADAIDGELIVEVKDTGIGIPPQMRDVIFESFRQVDASSSRIYGGSGLGLSIVRNLCRAMDGTVRVDSTPGIGSTFTVTLPLHTEKSLEKPVEVTAKEIK